MDERSYGTYFMASRSHTLYIGVSGNLHKRIFKHKGRGMMASLAIQLRPPGMVRELSGNCRGDRPREAVEGMETRQEDRVDREDKSRMG